METMTHPDEGTIQALLDGELTGDQAQRVGRHLEGCPSCGALARELTEVRGRLSAALAAGDRTPPHLPARETLRRRLSVAGGGGGIAHREDRPLHRRRWVAAAAGALLPVAAAATLLPGSPVREWLRVGAAEEGGTPSAEASRAIPDGVEPVPELAIFVRPSEGVLRVELAGMQPGAQVRVERMDRPDVAIHAPDGTRFETSPGRVHALVAPGGVRVELPGDGPSVSLWVNGIRYLTGAGGRLEVTGPAEEREGGVILFRVPGGGTSGSTGS